MEHPTYARPTTSYIYIGKRRMPSFPKPPRMPHIFILTARFRIRISGQILTVLIYSSIVAPILI